MFLYLPQTKKSISEYLLSQHDTDRDGVDDDHYIDLWDDPSGGKIVYMVFLRDTRLRAQAYSFLSFIFFFFELYFPACISGKTG